MIIVLKGGSVDSDIQKIVAIIEKDGLTAHVSKGTERTLIGAIGDERKLNKTMIEEQECVEKVMPILKPYKLASREFHPENTVIEIDDVRIGGDEITIMAGPCSLESEEQLMSIAHAVKDAGAQVLRASVYKPRTSPYDFQGYGDEGLKILKKAKDETGLLIETEVMDIRKVELAAKYVDMVRIGARNTQNFDLLKEVGKINKPVILKNGLATTLNEFIMCAEYIMSNGNHNVILCNRGIRTYETETRFTLDHGVNPILKQYTHLPLIVDPSHASGKRHIVKAHSKAAIASGADGLLVEVHNDPQAAMCDGKQSLTVSGFKEMMGELKQIASAVGRKM